MKFAKELEDDLVPEWRVKYFDYKQGKKKIKAVQRAVDKGKSSPRTPLRRALTPKTPSRLARQYSPWQGDAAPGDAAPEATPQLQDPFGATGPSDQQQAAFSSLPAGALSPTQPISVPQPAHEENPLTGPRSRDQSPSGTRWTRYGSIIGTPPSPQPQLSRAATLNLPEPALDGAFDEDSIGLRTDSNMSNRPIVGSAPTHSESPFEAGKTRHPSKVANYLSSRHRSLLAYDVAKTDTQSSERPLLRSIFSSKQRQARKSPKYTDFPLEARQEIDARKHEFFQFLDSEREKIESFYKEKEGAATHRIKVLKDQLHILKDQHDAELKAAELAKVDRRVHKHKKDDDADAASSTDGNGFRVIPEHLRSIPHNIDALYHPIQTAKQVRFGKDNKDSMLGTPPDKTLPSRDYTRKPEPSGIPYIQAKRKLKLALQEYYRGLELLKSYALLNRTAFRKINKKYDKATTARPTMRYMTEKVNNAWFVQSTVIDGHITACEDLYARYFEKGSHKIAVGKLRKKNRHAGAYTSSVFRNGLAAAAGAVLAIEGLVYGAHIFYSAQDYDPELATRTSYLLQIYAGYFLLLFLVLFFCLDCSIFARAKVNYVFVFEFDTRNNLDWRQLSELPCFFLLLMGFIMWLNFSRVGGEAMYIWWPIVLIGLTILIMFLPAPILYHDSRKWFLYSCWRLLGAGLYPVEFRDFFLGDMFCSQTYSFGGIELFFCIYANDWMNPQQCNSSSSRLLGFFTTLPGIMRLFQCLRRYKDTRDVFPHLVNGGKYTFTILQYASLSALRISETPEMRAFFITCATINGIYTSIWDLVMDWSLMDPFAEHRFLRPHLAYKSPYPYYAAMIIDPILRFNWIFYAIPFFTDEIQHSALLGFLVSFSEVIRRGIWTIFRVENEHCTNVGRFRASRDIALPYEVATESTKDLLQSPVGKPSPARNDSAAHKHRKQATQHSGSPPPQAADADTHDPAAVARRSDPEAAIDSHPATATGADLERSATRDTAVSSLRRRQQQGSILTPTTPAQSIRERVGTILRGAHAQDFERRRKHGEEHEAPDTDDEDSDMGVDDSDEDDERHHGAHAADHRQGQSAGTPQSVARASGASGGGSSIEEDEEARADRRRQREEDQEASRQNRSDLLDAEILLQRARNG